MSRPELRLLAGLRRRVRGLSTLDAVLCLLAASDVEPAAGRRLQAAVG